VVPAFRIAIPVDVTCWIAARQLHAQRPADWDVATANSFCVAPAINISRAWHGLFIAGKMQAHPRKRTTG
jgi:hypothetical protein